VSGARLPSVPPNSVCSNDLSPLQLGVAQRSCVCGDLLPKRAQDSLDAKFVVPIFENPTDLRRVAAERLVRSA
jgi:hypothetical protein